MSSEERERIFVKGQLSKSSSVPRMCSHTGKANVMSTGAVKYHKEKLFFGVLFIIIRTCTVYEIILWGFYWLYRDMKTTNQVYLGGFCWPLVEAMEIIESCQSCLYTFRELKLYEHFCKLFHVWCLVIRNILCCLGAIFTFDQSSVQISTVTDNSLVLKKSKIDKLFKWYSFSTYFQCDWIILLQTRS